MTTAITTFIVLVFLAILTIAVILRKKKKNTNVTTEVTTAVTTETTTETTAEPVIVPTEKIYWKFIKCSDSSEIWMEDSVKNRYENSLGNFQSGDRFYGAVEGDKNYLYTYTSQSRNQGSYDGSELRGVSRTSDVC